MKVSELITVLSGFNPEDEVFCWCEGDSTINGYQPRYEIEELVQKNGYFVKPCNAFKEDSTGDIMVAVKIKQ